MPDESIVTFLGSPRENGRTAKLLTEVVAGAQSVGMYVKKYHLNDSAIKGCQNCGYCRTKYGCPTKDGLTQMYDDIAAATAVVFATPCVFFQISGQSKLWLDRTFPMIGGVPGARHPQVPGKKVIALYTQGTTDADMFRPVIEGMNRIFGTYGWTVTACLLASGGDVEGTPSFKELLRQAHAAGAALAGPKAQTLL